ncbi:class I SAM-dependent methyltransferase [Nocardia nova]|uniref:class I SAM-dependent methyltransferase n=1 Tax=Nocardia nova TaxID=37330 RepID=UPI0033D7B2EE
MTEQTRIEPNVHGVEVTAFLTLYQRWQDNQRRTPLLDDRWPDRLVPRIDFDFGQFDRMAPFGGYSLTALRTRVMDDWIREFLSDNENAVVIDLGAGLDSRVFRIDPGPGHHWYDVDLPAVVELAAQLFPSRDGHTRIAASVADTGWIDRIPTDRPAVIVADGLFGFLSTTQAQRLFRTIADRFPHGEIVFNAYGPMIRKKREPVFTKYGITFGWTIEQPADVERLEPRLHFAGEASQFRNPLLSETSRACRLMCAAIRLSPSAAHATRLLKYRF